MNAHAPVRTSQSTSAQLLTPRPHSSLYTQGDQSVGFDDNAGDSYPNVQDNRYAVWREFGNDGWPGFYFVDTKGRVRGYRLGEGNYPEAEQLIQKLLVEAGHDPSDVPVSPIIGTGIEAEAAWGNPSSSVVPMPAPAYALKACVYKRESRLMSETI